MRDKTVEVKVKDNELAQKILENFRDLDTYRVKVGYQRGTKKQTRGEDGKVSEDSRVELVDVVAANEFGTSKIPARPFMQNSVDMYEDKIAAFMYARLQEIAEGKDVVQALKEIGAFQVGNVQMAIRDGEYVPNAPRTIAKKHSSKPLIDTGQMRQGVHYQITKKVDEEDAK